MTIRLKKMTIEVLISCMRQDDTSIIQRSNIQSDVVVINQCDENCYQKLNLKNRKGEEINAEFISSKERGLSKSRNMAVKYSKGDICLICDDDEILYDDYPELIVKAFEENSEADVLAFQIQDAGKIFPKSKKKIGYIGALKLASWQLAFRRKSIVDNRIEFDETLGSGVTKAGGEENRFLYDCLKKGLKITYVPIAIGKMIEGESQWFHGFTKEYFYDRGIMTKKLMGKFWASLYAFYFIVRKYPLYHKDVNVYTATSNLFRGLLK